MLTFRQFQKSYGDQLILQMENLTIPAGLHWIKGHNGSGKSTLFKTLAGLIPYSGSILYNKEVLAKNPVRHRQLVNFGEAEPLYPDFLTGRELLGLFIQAKKARAADTNYLIEALGVNTFLDKPVGTYSSGMLKKLSLLLAFTGNPQIILLDEPLITLDVATVQIIYALIQAYRAKGVSFLISSHQDIEMPELPINGTWLLQNQQLTLIAA